MKPNESEHYFNLSSAKIIHCTLHFKVRNIRFHEFVEVSVDFLECTIARGIHNYITFEWDRVKEV